VEIALEPPFLIVRPFMTRWSPEPDLLVVRPDRRHLLTTRRLQGPADPVIEIASDSDPGLDLREKLPRYREAGVEEMWFIDPFTQAIRVETKGPGGYTSRTLASGRLASGVVPGFWIEAAWLWREPLPSTLACLRDILGMP
jgi:Uma2 family endonuclease